MQSLDFLTWTTQPLVWRCLWILWQGILLLTTDRVLLLAELVILIRMLQLDQANHQLYKSFFEERKRWYQARGKKLKPVGAAVQTLPMEPGTLLIESNDSDAVELAGPNEPQIGEVETQGEQPE
jgi:hypothetical protein